MYVAGYVVVLTTSDKVRSGLDLAMSLSRLTYMSRPTAAEPPSFYSDQSAILATARANNIRDGLTGALLGNPDWFVQVLEGPSQKLSITLNQILADSRHRDVLIFEVAVAKDRMFENWSMHYSSLDDVEPQSVWDCVDSFRKGSILGGRSAIHALTLASERSVSRIAL
jgi:hypothetical protein